MGRIFYAGRAMEAFRNKPVFGNGIGSIFYLIGIYSHNLFTDILAETGLVGMIIIGAILTNFAVRMKNLFYCGSLYRFMLIIFICGITMNLFSGYIWANQHVWLPIAVVMIAPKEESKI